jgi:3-oxoadipate enol-lactonase
MFVSRRNPAPLIDAGMKLHYTRAGSGATGAVLIHELGGSVASWDEVAPGLGRSMQVVCYDQRGHGRSDEVCAPFSLGDQVDDLCALLEEVALPEPCWLVAAAAGAAIAVDFATRFPARAAGIAMCAPALDFDASRRRVLQERADLAARAGMQAIVDTTLERSWPSFLRNDRRAFERHRARLLASDPVSYALASRALCEIDLSAKLPLLRCPCLVLAGQHDLQRPPERVASQAARVPGAVFEVVPAGHLMAVQSPVEVTAKIRAFIDGGRS